jgi:chemotaxis signal transduction protein
MVAMLIPANGSQPTVAAGRFVRCIVGGVPFALPLARVAEVVAIGTATATAPRGWIGTLARNERPVPIGDLTFLLGFSHAPLNRREVRALILRANTDDTRYGVTIETVPQVFDAGGARAEPLPPVALPANGLVVGTIIQDDELLLILDTDAIIDHLATGITRGPNGRITELRALLRRNGESRAAFQPRATATPPPLRDEQSAIVLGPLEAADGSGTVVPALPIRSIQEVSPWQETRPIPHAPDAVSGMIVWRGHALPVLDLAQRLTGLPSDASAVTRRRLLIVGPQGETPHGALLVSAVRGLRTLQPATSGEQSNPPTLPGSSMIVAWTRQEGETVALLDPERLFAER